MSRFTIVLALSSTCLMGCGKDDGAISRDGGPGPGPGVDATAPGPDGSDGLFHIDRRKNASVGTTSALDYGDPNLWVCRPGIDANPCYGDHGELDATELMPDGSTKLVKHTRAKAPKFDCLYVYPTVYLEGSGNRTDLNDISYVMDALMAQGARLSEVCEVYAPLYRQVVITPGAATSGAGDAGAALPGDAGAAGDAGHAGDAGNAAPGDAGTEPVAGRLSGPAAALAVGDVRNAFAYYLEHLNKGRKFVLMGHSQGSGMLTGMMQRDVDPNPAVRARLLSALLIGGGATVAANQKVGGSFKNIPTCSSPGETGCVMAYSAFDSRSLPNASALFGRNTGGLEVACTDPAVLNGNSGPYKGSYFPMFLANAILRPSNPHTPDPGTAFILYRDAFRGECVNANGFSYLNVTWLLKEDDPRGVAPYHSLAEGIGFGLHLVDWNLPMRDLIEAVQKQAAAAGL